MIHLCRNLYLSADVFSYKVGRTRKHNGKTVFEPITYHCTLTEALRSAANRAVRDGVEAGEIESLNAVANQMESIMQELTAAVAGLDPAGK